MALIGPNTVSPVLHVLSIAGLTVFAISGALAAARQGLDIIAGGFFAVVTATGGGTVRDVLIDQPVFWMNDWTPIVICSLVTVAVWLVPLRVWPAKALDWFDAAGLSAFAVYGTAKALGVGVSPLPAVVMGVVTACLGGIIRDMVAGVPSDHASQRAVRHRGSDGGAGLRGAAACRRGAWLGVADRRHRRLRAARRGHSLDAGFAAPSRLSAAVRPSVTGFCDPQ